MAAIVLRQLSEGDLSRWFAPALLTAAEDYLVAERLRQPIAAGSRLTARLEGFRGDYEVTADLTGGADFFCSCGQRQPCRHVAALVLAWLRRRSWFTDVDVLVRPLAAAPVDNLLALLSRLAADPEDRLTPLLEAVQGVVTGQGAGTQPWAEPGRWLEPDAAAAAVVALAGRWDEAAGRLKGAAPRKAAGGDTQTAWQELIGVAEQGADLLGHTRDEAGLLTRFVGACLAQFAPLAVTAAVPLAARGLAVRALASIVGSGAVELAKPAAAALAALAAPDTELVGLAEALLLGQVWLQDAEWRGAGQPIPAAALLREGLLLEAAADLLVAVGREAAAVAALEPFPHIWQATLRRVAILRELGRPDEALQAARAGLEHAQGQAALDLHRVSGETLLALGRPAEAVSHLLALCLGRREAADLPALLNAATAAGSRPAVEKQLRAAGISWPG